MSGYQPHKMVEVDVGGMKLSRIAPTKPNSLRCKLGFHEMRGFELDVEALNVFTACKGGELPKYCERCDEIYHGRRILPRPAASSLPHKSTEPAKEETISYVKSGQTRAEEVLGLEINKLIDLQKVISSGDLEAIRFYVGGIKALRSIHDHPMNFVRNREILSEEEREVLASPCKPSPPEEPTSRKLTP
ncbi:deoxyribose-phosphate aldolase [Vibrio phage vB_VpaS_1601]|nr:deoxyribose-phosphate aldolase [Vibrio phage vB_VpaP_1601]